MGSGEFAKAWVIYSKNEENTNMTEKRVLNGYSKEVQSDFKKLSEDVDFPLYEIMQNSLEHLPALKELVDVIQDEDEDKRLLQDIADYIDGRAKFEEEKHIYRLANATLNGFSLYLTTNYDIQFSNNISKALELSKGELKFILTGTKFNQNQFEIVDLGDAKFPEQMYYVKLLDKEEGYLNCQKSFNDYFVNNNKDDDSDYQTQFTISEIEAIDPRYKQFAIPVED